jgi:hypothetical protein
MHFSHRQIVYHRNDLEGARFAHHRDVQRKRFGTFDFQNVPNSVENKKLHPSAHAKKIYPPSHPPAPPANFPPLVWYGGGSGCSLSVF